MTRYIGPKTDGENVATQADKLSLSSDTPDALTPDQSGAAGTALTAARADHQHEITAGIAGTILPDATAAEGSSTAFSRADHTHAITAASPGTITPDASAAEGSSNSFARADHTHAIAAASAGTITGTNSEGSSTSFARADHDHAITASLLVPTGAVMPYAGSSAPTGWLLCDGSEQAVSTYGALDTVLGTTYGSRTNGSGGSGSSHFRLPDLRGRMPVGKGTNGDVDALNDNDGQAEADRTPKHHHRVPTPTGSPDGSGAFSLTYAGRDSDPNTVATTPYNATSGAGIGGQDTPSYITLNYIIKT